jgi:sugar/nucleoside kinase (ribokinase family)
MMVVNSGYDVAIEDWRTILAAAACPVWFDVHSLVLDRKIGAHRPYVALPDWREWVAGTTYLQANRQEVACLLGRPERWVEASELAGFFAAAFDLGVQAVFVTLGKDGVWTATPKAQTIIPAPEARSVVDTTGCGDVFAAATIVRLARGEDAHDAVRQGVVLAAAAAGAAGIEETYALAVRARFDRPEWM